MAYDEGLADRIRSLLGGAGDVVEKRMFGGLAFMERGNMTVGVHGADLIARVGPEATAAALERPGAREFDLSGGRPMKGWVVVAGDAVRADKALRSWVSQARAYAATLPAK